MRPSLTTATQVALLVIAGAVVLFTTGPSTVERDHSRGFYPILQSTNITAFSNRLPFAVFDLAIVVFILIAIGIWHLVDLSARGGKQALRPRAGDRSPTLTLLAIIHLWFLAAWGLNYARPPLESVLAYDAARDHAARRARAGRARGERGQSHPRRGHAAGFPAIADVAGDAGDGAARSGTGARATRPTVWREPKRSLLSPFFRASGVSGNRARSSSKRSSIPISPDPSGPSCSRTSGRIIGVRARVGRQLCRLAGRVARRPRVAIQRVARAGVGSGQQLQPVTQRLVLESWRRGRVPIRQRSASA